VRPPSEFLHFTRTLTSKFAYRANDVLLKSCHTNTFIDIKKCLFYSNLPQTTINKAINDLRKRLNACVSADCGHFEHIM